MKHLLKNECPNLKNTEYRKALLFIDGRCSQYYFLDYLKCCNNVADAIKLYDIDDKFRCILFQHLIRFEIQIKSEFIACVKESTKDASFWKHKKYFIEEAIVKNKKGNLSKYAVLKKTIQQNIDKTKFNTIGPLNNVALYTSSFGTFETLYKLLKLEYKSSFIDKYTSCFPYHSYKILFAYLEGIRRVRNRCAHGTHIITTKLVNDLNDIRNKLFPLNTNQKYTSLESIIKFIIYYSKTGNEFKNKLFSLFSKHECILSKYSKRLSISSAFLKKIT